MSWNGADLLTRFSQKYGLTDTTSLARIMEWMNEIQEDICSSYKWSFLKHKVKKRVSTLAHQFDISPEIASAPSGSATSGGSLTADTAYQVKVTFLLFSANSENFIESEAGSALSVTPSGGNLTISLTSIPTYSGSTSVLPTTIHRRIYVKKGTANFYFHQDIEDNTTTTATISTDPDSEIEPPNDSMVQFLSSEDPFVEESGYYLRQVSLDDILKYDPNLSSSGTPDSYARVSPTEIFLYPKPSTNITLSYFVFKRPSQIFNESDRKLQLPQQLKTVLEAGVTWKMYEYRDRDGQESKLSNYEELKRSAFGKNSQVNGKFLTVREVY